MKIINLEGFRQIKADTTLCESYYNNDNVMSALSQNGVTLINRFYGSVESIVRTTQTVNTVERTGLALTINSTYSVLYSALPDLSKSAAQIGFRLTLGEGKKNTSSLINIDGSSFDTKYPDEAASYYYELFVTRDNNRKYATAKLYCNRSLVGSKEIYVSDERVSSIEVGIGSNSYTIFSGTKGTMMIGDMYCATIDYGLEKSAEPSLLGSIEVKCNEVTGCSGGVIANSLSKNIVDGLNSSNSSAGYLMLSQSSNATTVTFSSIDNSAQNVIAVMPAVTYRSSDAPNNVLAWKVKQGGQSGELVVENDMQSDTNSWTTATQVFMTQPSGGQFAAGNLDFSVELFNQSRVSRAML